MRVSAFSPEHKVCQIPTRSVINSVQTTQQWRKNLRRFAKNIHTLSLFIKQRKRHPEIAQKCCKYRQILDRSWDARPKNKLPTQFEERHLSLKPLG